MFVDFYQPTDTVIQSLIQLFRLQNKLETVNLLENSEARIEDTDYDNWDGGTIYFTLFLDIPLKLFAHLEHRIDQFERSISGKLSSILRDTGNHRLNRVVISPKLANPTSGKTISKLTDEDVSRIWKPSYFRLFLSHISGYKKEILAVKNELEIYRISGFLAHEDIEPTKEWENEILIALNSAYALAAFLTPDFHQSKWTDQELGIALGHGLFIIPIKIGIDPYGFMAKKQALHGSFEEIEQLAIDLVEVLLKHAVTSKPMCEALVRAFEKTNSFINARKISQMIIKANNFTQEQLLRIRQTCNNNDQAFKSFGVPERIDSYLNKLGFDKQGVPL